MNTTLWVSALGLLIGAGSVSPPRDPLPVQGRDLVRPVVLPMLWAGLESAQRTGTPEEYAARGRMLMKLIPHWTDGHALIAGQLAFEASLAQTDPAAALDRLMAALEYLDAARAESHSPAAGEWLVKTQARFLYIRASQDPALAAAFRQRTGESPTVQVSKYLRSIPRLADSKFLQSELCFLLIDGLAVDLRLREPTDRVIRELDKARSLLDSVKDRELADKWRSALRILRSYLTRTDDTTLEDLAANPLLETIVDALRPK